jgi:HEAT repeat protein
MPMPLIILLVLIIAVFWWVKSERTLSLNERLYLRRRGYATEDAVEAAPPIPKDARLFGLIESLGDLSPFARQRAAEDLSRMCREGQRDHRMLPSLVVALNDRDASVRGVVAEALGNLGSADAIEPLRQRLEVEDSIHVRSALRKAIGRLQG